MKPESEAAPKLRMAALDSAEQLARELARDQLTANRDRELGLEQSLAGFRVGSVKALNAVPLTRGIEDEKLAHKLIADISRAVYEAITR